MSRFAIRNPYFIVVVCLIIAVVGVSSLARMPVDMFPAMNIPVVVVATFYSGMPPEQIETDITSRFERFFTLGSGIEHIESRSLPGVSVIKVYFQPGTNPDSAVTTISNLAMAQLRRLPPGTLPPVVLKFDASSLPVCLVTFKGEGLNETQLRDLAQFQVRNQIAERARAPACRSRSAAATGRSWSTPIRYKLEAHQLSLMDVVRVGQRRQPDSARRRRADRPARLQHLHQQPVAQRQRDQPAADQDGGPGAGARRRYRLRQGRAADPDQPRARGRPALGLSAGAEAGRRHQHHRGGGWHQGRACSICSTFPSNWSRKVVFDQSRIREDGDRDAAARRRASACC